MLYNAYNNCDTELPDHYCNPCLPKEFGRVRSVAMITTDYLPTLMAADPTLAASWQAGIDAKKIIVIPQTSGTFDPGDPKQLKGYGDVPFTNGQRGQALEYFDPNYAQNWAFYNTITNATQYVMAFRTSTLIHIADLPANINAKDKVEDDLETEINWDVKCSWNSVNIPSIHDATNLMDIFSCTGF